MRVTIAESYSIFDTHLKKHCSKCRTYMPLDWKINAKTVVQPDLMVVGNEFTTIHLEFTPALVVEILSTVNSL